MTRSTGQICIVANELNHLFRNGGIGTHNWLLAEALADAGWSVHVLYCSEIEKPSELERCQALWKPKGIKLWHLPEFRCPPEDDVECGLVGWLDKHSMHVRRAVEQLHGRFHFDLIEFAEWAGYGFRTIQSHSMNGSLADARLIVKLHSSSQWCRDGNRTWLCNSDDLIRDYFERYSFENADIQLSPSRYMFEYARSIGWDVRDDARVIPYCYPTSTSRTNLSGEVSELVFFGRLEARKGLTLFLEAARTLPSKCELHLSARKRRSAVSLQINLSNRRLAHGHFSYMPISIDSKRWSILVLPIALLSCRRSSKTTHSRCQARASWPSHRCHLHPYGYHDVALRRRDRFRVS